MSPTESPEPTEFPELYDVLVIGSGAAGLGLALRLAPYARVAVLSKGALREGGTYYAQGGVSAVLDESDSVDAHVADTLDAGAGLCDEEIVRFTVERGPAAIRRLVDIGVPFTRVTRSDGSQTFHLTREGGHGHRRVIHAADASGRAIESTLLEHVRAQPSVTLLANHMSVDLITGRKLGLDHGRCVGAYVLDRECGRVEAIAARFVVLATGGASRVYLYTSNPDVSTGDGVAMAWRAGCRIVNLEFIQFHPTCLFHPKAKSFLISEAVRGEGGRLLLPDGSRPRRGHRGTLQYLAQGTASGIGRRGAKKVGPDRRTGLQRRGESLLRTAGGDIRGSLRQDHGHQREEQPVALQHGDPADGGTQGRRHRYCLEYSRPEGQ